MTVVLFGLASVSLAASYQWIFPTLPPPESADRQGLFRWLVLRDLGQQSPGVRRTLRLRLEDELDLGIDLVGTTSGLGETRADKLHRNIRLLFGEWLTEQWHHCQQLSRAERTARIDALIRRVDRWGLLPLLAKRPGTQPTSENATNPGQARREDSPALSLVAELNTWVATQPEPQQPAARRFATAVAFRSTLYLLQQ